MPDVETSPYKVFAVDADGNRKCIDCRSVIVELRPGIEIEIDTIPHQDHRGSLILMTPPAERMKVVYDEGKVDDFAVVFAATNVLQVEVERRVRPGDGKAGDDESTPQVVVPDVSKASG